MTPDQVLMFNELCLAIVKVAFFGGLFGACAYDIGKGAVLWLIDRLPVSKKYRDYQVACMLARQQAMRNRAMGRGRSRGQ